MRTPPTILIVEDDASHRRMLDVILGSWGYVTQQARNGPGALALIQQRDVDLVLMDINLAHASGIEVLKVLRSLDPHLPVVLMTAYCPPEMAREASEMGAGNILIKPIRLDELEDVIQRALGQTPIASAATGA